MTQSGISPLIELDWADFRPWSVTSVKHRISEHPLLQPDQLIQLSQRLEQQGRIRTHSSQAAADTPFNDAPSLHPNSASTKYTLEHIREAKAWLSLLNVQTDPTYRRLVDEVLDSIRPLVEARDPGMCYRGGWIFVSSPHTVTPFHFDKEHNFILQIQGRKTIYVWEPNDVAVVDDRARDRFHARRQRDKVAWKEEFRSRAHRFDVGPGQGAYMPSTAPHLVEVGEEPSITISFTYYTNSTRRDAVLRTARGRLSEFGINLPALGESAWLDRAMYHGAVSVRAAKGIVSQFTGKQMWMDSAVYAQPR
jgi:ribosomal protein L16 Arg81 hydroxylase